MWKYYSVLQGDSLEPNQMIVKIRCVCARRHKTRKYRVHNSNQCVSLCGRSQWPCSNSAIPQMRHTLPGLYGLATCSHCRKMPPTCLPPETHLVLQTWLNVTCPRKPSQNPSHRASDFLPYSFWNVPASVPVLTFLPYSSFYPFLLPAPSVVPEV